MRSWRHPWVLCLVAVVLLSRLAAPASAGVHVQQTSTSQGSPFIRGLTGQQVVTLIDGVRFNNATLRPGANRYDQLNGGLGKLVNRFDPQTLDFLFVRYDRVGLPLADTFSASVSFNGLRDDRVYQSVNNTKLGLRSPVSEERNRTNVVGYQVQASRLAAHSHALVVGGELYDEKVNSTATRWG